MNHNSSSNKSFLETCGMLQGLTVSTDMFISIYNHHAPLVRGIALAYFSEDYVESSTSIGVLISVKERTRRFIEPIRTKIFSEKYKWKYTDHSFERVYP